MNLVFATNNSHKIKEIQDVLGNAIHLLSLKDIGCSEELSETHHTLEGNALEKAEYIYNKYKQNCFADDTGLEIDALNGEPGVYSARYVGELNEFSSSEARFEANIQKVLANMQGITNRNARFRTIIVLIENGTRHYFEGIVNGIILPEKKGNQGFGYDPIFCPLGYDKSFAEMSLGEKNKISHRGIAVNKLVDYLLKK
ncbi:MAG: non-canonical purine NTP diphosphatase [Bacteroidota bacterium]|nr:non-canonical purine NTP diphosphatase [Bacteroidota bacterium]MDP4225194.1 non-canonical purine NTP diphosphatase [Bacteroidota bacterium]MDP4274975.1 non-canonical purine NTP diphosphatase [Bacteroidota bacterium]